jgi:hypothetical protein
MAEPKIDIPAAQANLPETVEKKWKEAYQVAFKEAQNDWPDDPPTQKQQALREANRVLKTPELTSYSHAASLEEWHFVLRAPSTDGKTLRVVTRHGKKYTFPIPAKAQKPADEKKQDGDGKKGGEGAGAEKTA